MTETTCAGLYKLWSYSAQCGVARTRSGSIYKPSVLRAYDHAWNRYLLPEFGRRNVATLRRRDVQALIDRLVAERLAPQTIRNVVTALRAVFRWGVTRDIAPGNPCLGIELPAGGRARDRILSPSDAQRHIDVLPTHQDRAIWALAFFGGLRLGELQALREEHLVFDASGVTVQVRSSYDERAKSEGAPKSKAGVRDVPLPDIAVPYLEWYAAPYLLGDNDGRRPFSARNARAVASEVWERHGLEPVGFHDARHTYASIMLAAGVNIKAVQTYMGHANVAITLDRYGHLLPGADDEARAAMNAYIAGS